MLTKDERPFRFSDVVGQESKIKAFKYYLKTPESTFPDVLLFQGASGSGKTTCASIIAATINCEHPVLNKEGYYEPCGECESCKSIKSGIWNNDVHFFNAAKMEAKDVLDLEHYASMAPWRGGKKTIIIIDEFQELSKKSTGSTLVLLEKKRQDSMFILCTMADKIEKAVKDRTQFYQFKELAASQILSCLNNMLLKIYPDENMDIPFEASALTLIAQNSGGSARSAIQTLERCVASQLYTVEDIKKEFSFISEEESYNLVNMLVNKDTKFFDAVKDFDIQTLQSFYIYAWTILSGIYKTLIISGEDDWKYKSSKTIKDNPNYPELEQCFMNIEKMGYFKNYIFDYYIGNYFYNNKQKEVSVPVVEQPKRTRIRTN